MPGSEVMRVDMNQPLPVDNNSFSVVVADISLHYFDVATTISIMKEIKRILKPKGVLLTRVSSMNDVYYGAGSGIGIEERFYDHGSYAQRYFNEEDIKRFFGLIGKYTFKETSMTRKESILFPSQDAVPDKGGKRLIVKQYRNMMNLRYKK